MMAEAFDRNRLPSMIDHTLLKPDAGEAAIRKLCEEAVRYRFRSVCVNGTWVALCRDIVQGTGVGVAAVCGFPLGAAETSVKAREAAVAAEQGASEIDMVLQVGRLLAGEEEAVRRDIEAVVRAVEGQAIVKVIMETGLLTEAAKIAACRLAVQAGAHFVKTSTGFGPGGADVRDIALMRANVPEGFGVKASGGIRDFKTALAMIQAGANRLGTSAGVAIMNGASGEAAY